MKKIFLFVMILALCAGSVFAQSWNQPLKAHQAPGVFKFHNQMVLKQWVSASDSSAKFKLVGSDSTIRVLLGILPEKCYMTSAVCYVQAAFTGDTKDSVCVGSSTDIDLYINEFAVSSTGTQTATLLSNYIATQDTLYLYYRRTVSQFWPAAGNVALFIEYVQLPN